MNRTEKLNRIAENQRQLYESGRAASIMSRHGGIQFTSDALQVVVKYRNSGPVSFYVNDNLIMKMDNPNTDAVVESQLLAEGASDIFRIEGIENLVELNLSGQYIRTIVVDSYTSLEKLVIYDNHITNLDLSKCTQLRYLHFHNNPICDEDVYEANLNRCIRSLPDRTGKALGSILLYPWYGLETLVCEDDGVYRKYPIGTYTHYNDTVKYDMNNDREVTIIDGKLYGLVIDNDITYYTGHNSALLLYSAMNRHHSLRKTLEQTITLSKNWMFGSAIQYHDDYRYCYHYFRDIGVQDVWETAEKGFGICIGSVDNYNGRINDWEDLNVKAFLDVNGNPVSPSGEKSSHGDKIISHIAGRGGLSPYGICPNSSFLMMGPLTVNDNTIKLLTRPGNCDTLTFSFGYTKDDDKYKRRYYLGKFGESGIITESAGNDGDGLPWTMDGSYKMSGFGDYGDSESDTLPIHHTTTFFVGSLDPMRNPSVFSCNSTESGNMTYGNGLTTEDFISHYGEQIACYKMEKGGISYTQGTSMSSPNCCATLALMRVIYSKLNPECTYFGKKSEFMEYVKHNWMDPVDHAMSFAVGIGIPCFRVGPRDVLYETDCPAQFSYPSEVVVGKPFSARAFVTDGCKDGLTYNYSFKDYAGIGDKLVPIRHNAGQFQAYTNSALSNPADYAKNYKSETITGITKVHDSADISMSAADLIMENGLASVGDVECVAFNHDSTDFSVHIPIKFDYDHIAIGSPESGKSYKALTFAKHFDGNTSTNILAIPAVNIEAGNKISVPHTYEYLDENGEPATTTNRMVYRFHNDQGNAFAGSAARLGIEEGDTFVLTLTFDSKKGTSIYFNGNLMTVAVPCDDCTVSASEVFVPKDVLIHDAVDDVIYIDRVLTHEEVINNTIVILKELETE